MIKLEVGHKVVFRPINNQLRYSKDLEHGYISRIGRKYYYAKIDGKSIEYKFLIGNNEEENDWVAHWRIYNSEEEIEAEKELREASLKLKERFRRAALTADMIKEINQILDKHGS